MTIKKEIEIDLPDDVAAEWEPVAFREVESGEHFMSSDRAPKIVILREANCYYGGPRLILTPKPKSLVTRIAEAVIAGECGFTPALVGVEHDGDRWWVVDRYASHWSCFVTGPIPPHEPGDPDTVLVSDINAEVERLREGGGV